MSWSNPAYEAVARLVAARTGLIFPPARREGAELAIRRAMRRAGDSSPERYGERLATDAAALDDLVGELTVGKSYFFREPGQFEFLRRQVLPELRRRAPVTRSARGARAAPRGRRPTRWRSSSSRKG